MLVSRVLKAVNSAFTMNMMSVFWDCLQLAVTEAGQTMIPPLLILNNPVLDIMTPTNSTIPMTTGPTDRIPVLHPRKFETAMNTRTIEMVGIVLSFITVCISIIIFHAFPSLRSRRIVIHRNLFYGLLMEVTVRMILYTQQSYSFDDSDHSEENARGIEYFPYVCEGVYILLEYSRLVVYGWMFIEGIFLNSLISAKSLRNEIPIIYFYVGGWGGPAIIIAIWATVVGRHYANEPLHTCWYGYNYLPSYYIIQGPILAIVAINMLFLGTIMSVIVMKLRRTNDSELRKIQKTLRATIILLPLLGIINVFHLFDYPLNGSSTGFAVWAYFTHFFRSFQGVFISFIYCFTNEEVGRVISKKFERRTWCRYEWMERRRRPQPRRAPEPTVFAIAGHENIELAPIQIQTWVEPLSTHVVTDIEAGPIEAGNMSHDYGKAMPGPSGHSRSRSLSGNRIPKMESVQCYAEADPRSTCPVWERLRSSSTDRDTQTYSTLQNRLETRTLAFHLPADDRPGSRIDISIERRSSADAPGGQNNEEEIITLRRSSAESPYGNASMKDIANVNVRPFAAMADTASCHIAPIPACAYHAPRVYDETAEYVSSCSSSIPSIPPPPALYREDSKESLCTTESGCGCFSCLPRRRPSISDNRSPRDLAVPHGTEYQPNRISRRLGKGAKKFLENQDRIERVERSHEVYRPRRNTEHTPRKNKWGSCLLPNFETIEPARSTSYTTPRQGRREVFVRPGLKTRDSQTQRSKSLNCL